MWSLSVHSNHIEQVSVWAPRHPVSRCHAVCHAVWWLMRSVVTGPESPRATHPAIKIIKLSPGHRKFIFNDNFYFYLSFEHQPPAEPGFITIYYKYHWHRHSLDSISSPRPGAGFNDLVQELSWTRWFHFFFLDKLYKFPIITASEAAVIF